MSGNPSTDVAVRPAVQGDGDAIDAVLRAAFPTDAEARLVRALAAAGADSLSLVAHGPGGVLGHVLLSPVELDPAPAAPPPYLAVAPLAVLPQQQRRGIGAALMNAAVRAARQRGVAALFLLGDPAYYRRFGFRSTHIANTFGAGSAFMALPLVPAALDGVRGTARYHPAFDAL